MVFGRQIFLEEPRQTKAVMNLSAVPPETGAALYFSVGGFGPFAGLTTKTTRKLPPPHLKTGVFRNRTGA